MSDWDTPQYRASEREEYHAIRLLYPEIVNEIPFACRAGWYGIIADCLEEMQRLVDQYPGTSVGLTEVKQKLAGLRIYTGHVDEEIFSAVNDAIEAAERRSEKTCEICGRPGVVRSRRGFLVTRCDTHADGAEVLPPREET